MANALLLQPLTPAAVTATSTAGGFDAAYLGNDYRGVVWRSAAGDVQNLLVDLGSDQPIDTVMLFGLSGNIPDGASAQLKLATQAQGASFPSGSWASALFGPYAGNLQISPGNGVLFAQADGTAPAAARYLMLSFSGLGSTGYVQAARLVVGKALQLKRNFSYGAGFGVKDLGALDFSRRGVLLRSRGAKLRTVSLTFSNISKDEVEASTRPLLEQLGNTECVALVTDPTEQALWQRRCYFGPLVGDLGDTWRNARAFEARINLISIF